MTTSIPTSSTRQEMLLALYQELFPAVAAYIHQRGGKLEDAKDVFHDALILYYEQVSSREIFMHQAYLMGIVKHLWMKRSGTKVEFIPLDQVEVMDQKPSPKEESLLRYLKKTGKKCLDLLTAFYYDHLSMKEIALRFGFAGDRSATVQKYKCLEKVREAIRKKSLSYEDFME